MYKTQLYRVSGGQNRKSNIKIKIFSDIILPWDSKVRMPGGPKCRCLVEVGGIKDFSDGYGHDAQKENPDEPSAFAED